MPDRWKKNLVRNTITNYLRTAVRLLQGLILFRMTVQHFTQEQFGYWALLWSGFGMTVLVDFGMGLTAQKEAAYRTARKEWEELSRLLSTMVWTFVMIGAAIFLIVFLIKPIFLGRIGISPENYPAFERSYWFFFGALALGFPMGLFPEVLCGLQRLDLVNWTMIVTMLLNIVFFSLAVVFHWPFESFFLISIVCALAPDVIAFVWVRMLIPQLSLSPRLYHLASIRGILSFSITSYIITLTNLIITRTAQAIISFCLKDVSAVAIYQVGYKIAELFATVTYQLQYSISPAAAYLNATGDRNALNGLLVNSSRVTLLFATPGYFLAAAYMRPLIELLTGMEHVDEPTFFVGQFLLLSVYSTLITSSCSKRIMMMSGWESPLLRLSIAEAVLNLILSILLVYPMQVKGVALGIFIPAFLIGWFWLTPLTLKFVNMTLGEWIRKVYVPVLPTIALSLLLHGVIQCTWPLNINHQAADSGWLGWVNSWTPSSFSNFFQTSSMGRTTHRILSVLFPLGTRFIIVMLPVGWHIYRFRKKLF